MVPAVMEQWLTTRLKRYPKPPESYYRSMRAIVYIRKLLLRHLALPRPHFLRFTLHAEPDTASGRLNAVTYISHPWYVKPSLWKRWGLEAWATWLVGGTLPGDEGSRYIPQGFKTEELGPNSFQGKGLAHMAETKARLVDAKMGACPFAFQR